MKRIEQPEVGAAIGGRGSGEPPHPDLEFWRCNVGDAVGLDLAPPCGSDPDGIDVLTWNVAIGRARLAELLGLLRGGAFGGVRADPRRPLVILLQEAYREDPSVPEALRSDHHGGHPGGTAHTRWDIVDFARSQGLSLRYAPSMRNGAHRSDRGNAILSTAAIAADREFALPYVRQRRIVIAVELGRLPWLTFVSAHVDTHGQPRGGPRFGRLAGGRIAQTLSLAHALARAPTDRTIIMGADLNTMFGLRDPALGVLREAGFEPAGQVGFWKHTFHGPFRVRLDHVLTHAAADRIASATVARLDEDTSDRGRRIFGSDHHPLLARLELRRP